MEIYWWNQNYIRFVQYNMYIANNSNLNGNHTYSQNIHVIDIHNIHVSSFLSIYALKYDTGILISILNLISPNQITNEYLIYMKMSFFYNIFLFQSSSSNFEMVICSSSFEIFYSVLVRINIATTKWTWI